MKYGTSFWCVAAIGGVRDDIPSSVDGQEQQGLVLVLD